MRAALIGTAILGLALVTGCSSSTSGESSAAASPPLTGEASAAAAAAALPPLVGTPWVLPSPTSKAHAAEIWCTALNQAVTTVANTGNNRAGMQKKMDALVSYEELWKLATSYGYVTQQEAGVNTQFLQGYEEMTRMEAAGTPATDPKVVGLTATLNKLTTDAQSLFDSSATKVTTLCGGSASAEPVPSASN